MEPQSPGSSVVSEVETENIRIYQESEITVISQEGLIPGIVSGHEAGSWVNERLRAARQCLGVGPGPWGSLQLEAGDGRRRADSPLGKALLGLRGEAPTGVAGRGADRQTSLRKHNDPLRCPPASTFTFAASFPVSCITLKQI